MILGIDEVGRGPWAGPLVVGAVVLPSHFSMEGLTDSKKLTAKKRAVLDAQIREQALGWGLGWVHAEELDQLGLSQALKIATIRAVTAVKTPYHEIIIDGTINFLNGTAKARYVTTMPKADALIPAVSAASIIAKVARDTFMSEQDGRFPEYGFSAHVGYGTAKHRQALDTYGVTTLHRKSFAPIAALLSGQQQPASTATQQLRGGEVVASTKAIGDAAEAIVATWLAKQGFRVVARNWKTKHCEIDIVAEKAHVRYFIEVKYRSSEKQGGGIEAITAKKLHQMRLGADLYNTRHVFTGDSRLAVVAMNHDHTHKQTKTIHLIEIE